MTTEKSGMTKDEEELVTWMDDVNLEEVNLLGRPADQRGDDFDTKAGEEKKEERVELPPQKSLGWDVQ